MRHYIVVKNKEELDKVKEDLISKKSQIFGKDNVVYGDDFVKADGEFYQLRVFTVDFPLADFTGHKSLSCPHVIETLEMVVSKLKEESGQDPQLKEEPKEDEEEEKPNQDTVKPPPFNPSGKEEKK